MARCLVLCALLGACRIGYQPLGLGSADAGRPDGGPLDAGTAPVDAASGDAPGLDAAPPADGCHPMPAELCNRIDDDCDGAVDETWTVVPALAACASPAREGAFTLAGATWDQADAIRSASAVTGAVENRPLVLSPHLPAGIDTSRGVGNLLGFDMPGESVFLPFPEAGSDPAVEPNVDRVEIEMGLGSFAVPDGDGGDFVVYEQGSPVGEPEAYAVAVHDARTGAWTPYRYQHFTTFEMTAGLFATAFDLSDYGVPVADAIRIANVFSATTGTESDRVDGSDGQGRVFWPGDPGWETAMPLLGPSGMPYPVSLLDTDLVWVVALHPTVEPRCCPP